MSSLLLSTIEDAQEYGYESLPDADDLYHSLRWLKMDEGVGIARPFSVLSVPGAGRSPAAAAGWGLVVDEAAFWPFMRIDFVLSRLLEDRQVPRTPGIDKMLDSLMPSAYLGALRGGTTRLPVRAGLTGRMALQATTEVLDGGEAMARAEGIRSIAFLYVPPEDLPLRRALRDRGDAEFGPTPQRPGVACPRPHLRGLPGRLRQAPPRQHRMGTAEDRRCRGSEKRGRADQRPEPGNAAARGAALREVRYGASDRNGAPSARVGDARVRQIGPGNYRPLGGRPARLRGIYPGERDAVLAGYRIRLCVARETAIV